MRWRAGQTPGGRPVHPVLHPSFPAGAWFFPRRRHVQLRSPENTEAGRGRVTHMPWGSGAGSILHLPATLPGAARPSQSVPRLLSAAPGLPVASEQLHCAVRAPPGWQGGGALGVFSVRFGEDLGESLPYTTEVCLKGFRLFLLSMGVVTGRWQSPCCRPHGCDPELQGWPGLGFHAPA